MAMEIRHIVFRPDEVIAAMNLYWARLSVPHPVGTVVECGPVVNKQGEFLRFHISFVPPHSQGTRPAPPEAATVNPNDLAAALILYCRSARIPLPRLSGKKLDVYGKQVCLMATMNPTKDTPLSDHPMVLHGDPKNQTYDRAKTRPLRPLTRDIRKADT